MYISVFFFSHDMKKSDTNAYSLLLKPLISQMKVSYWPNTLVKYIIGHQPTENNL